MLSLFEEETRLLNSFALELHVAGWESERTRRAVAVWAETQRRSALAAQKIANILLSYKERRFSLDDVDLDMDSVVSKLGGVFADCAGFLEMNAQQVR